MYLLGVSNTNIVDTAYTHTSAMLRYEWMMCCDIAAFLKWLENHFEDTIVARQRYTFIYEEHAYGHEMYTQLHQRGAVRTIRASVPIKFKFPHLIFQYVLWFVACVWYIYVHTLYWSRHNNVVTTRHNNQLVSAASYAHHIKVSYMILWL